MRVVCVTAGERRRLAVLEDGRLTEYLEETGSGSAAEAVYLGKVERVVPGIKAAFVDIGQEKNGFLPLDERSLTFQSEKLQTGQHVLVQVKKEAQGQKGAYLTRDITLCGEYVLLMPMNRYIGVSARIEDEQNREALRGIARGIAGNRFGLVMRTSALNAAIEDIRTEVEKLADTWAGMMKAAPTAHAPSMIHSSRTALDALVDDYRPRGIDKVITNDPSVLPALGELTVESVQEDPMILTGAANQLDKALKRHVWLESGGSIVIDRCEAMTVIDVNTAKFTGRKDLQETILKLNLEACGEIARQVRLRNLCGIILIDMIDMEGEENRRQVLERLRECFRQDRVKTVIHGFTSLGLVEMTRKKTRQPLDEVMTKHCPACHGTGRIIKEEHHG